MNKGRLAWQIRDDAMRLEARKVADELRPRLAKEKEWNLAIGLVKEDKSWEFRQTMKAVSRMTKKAVRMIYPDYVCSVRLGTGTALDWVDVNLIIPELEPEKVYNTSRQWEYKGIIRRIEYILLALGIKYGQFYTDIGPDDSYQPCLTISINGIG